MFKTMGRVFAIIAIGVISGIIGLVVGALIGGNWKFADQLVFNGVRGYEATSQIGFILCALIGVILSWRFLSKRK